MNEEKKLSETAKPEIPEVEKPISPYDPEVAKKRLEVYERFANKCFDTLKEMLELKEILKILGKKELYKLILFVSLILVIFSVTAHLACRGVISGEGFTFLVGTIVGFLFAYSLPRIV